MRVDPSYQTLGLRTLGASLGHVVSFTLGGYLLEHFSWRLIFFLGIPSGLAAAAFGFLVLPQRREYQGIPIDYHGLLLLASCLVPLLLVINFGRDSEAAGSTLWVLSLAAVAGGGLFVLRELLADFPAVNLHLFRIPAFCILGSERIRMGQGLMGVTRNIGSGLEVTITSVVFERRRVMHQLLGYAQHNDASPAHTNLLHSVTHSLHQAGLVGNTADQAALRTIRRQIDIEATAAGFRDSFLFIGLCFLISSLPMLWGFIQRHCIPADAP